jgi:hypothetical protein
MDVLQTLAHQYFIARNEADEDTDTLDLTSEGDFANRPAESGTFLGAVDVNTGLTSKVPVNGITFAFTGGAAADKTFTWKLFAWKCGNGCARQVAQGTGALGTQAVIRYPHNGVAATDKFWTDTLTVTWWNWYKEVRSTDTTGHNTQAEIWLDACGWRYWYIEIADADGSTGTEAGDVAAYYGYF